MKFDSHNVGDGSTVIQGNKGDVKNNKIKSKNKGAKVEELLPALLAAVLKDAESLPAAQRQQANDLVEEIKADLPEKPTKKTLFSVATRVSDWAKLAGVMLKESFGIIETIQNPRG